MKEQLKSYKTVEQIAKKHRMNVSDIQKQLDMGAPIEHEHTNNQKLAVEIALQHLDEIPDYYTRLKKMEADAKREHKKFKDVSENTDALDYDWHTPVRERADRYCPKCEKLETRSECKYGTRYWDMFSLPAELISSKKDYNITMPHPANEEKDHEYSMARSELSTVMNAARRLKKKMKGEGNIEAWVQSKITKAADYIDTAADYVDSRESKVNEDVTIEDANGNTFVRIIDIIKADRLVKEAKSGDQGLRDWFGKSKSSTGKKGWVQLGGKFAGEPCARQEGQTSTPKCGSSKMAANLSPEEEEQARRRKNRLDPNQPQKSGGAKPTNVRTEEINIQEVKDKPGKGSGKKDACYNKVKSRYDVWPSAYASGALVKCRKVGAANWGTKSEDCWDGYKQEGMKKKGKKTVPNCVPEQLSFEIGGGHKAAQKQAKIRNLATGTSNPNEKKVALGKLSGPSLPLANSYTPKTFSKFMAEASPAWQRKEGKNSEGGLNKKGIASYRKENPGSKLSLAVTTKPSKLKKGSKSANRRKSFCSRMSGMKKKLTSTKTANDPNSRINKSLRKWNC
jgi:hypothetical protein